MAGNDGSAGLPIPPVSNSTQRFMLLNSFLESQRASRFALSTVQHCYSDIPPPPTSLRVFPRPRLTTGPAAALPSLRTQPQLFALLSFEISWKHTPGLRG